MSTAGASSRSYYEKTRAEWRRVIRLPLLLFLAFALALSYVTRLVLPHHKEFAAGLLLGMGIGLVWALWDNTPDFIENWRDGAEGEERTAKQLHALGSEWRLIHDLPDAYGNIDHIVVGPGGVFLLDTKNRRGRLAVEEGVLVQYRPLSPRNTFRDFRLGRRMRGAAVSLKDRLESATGLNEYVHAVVVMWGDFEQGQIHDDRVTYISGEKLVTWLNAQPPSLDRRTVNLLALALESGLAVAS